jgi:hypothetical protein
MRIRSRLLLLLALLALVSSSCATVGLTPEGESMPAARMSLPPEQRVFYDALQGYGDWMLIEPLGYVFRPYDTDEYWHPYRYGYWAPSAQYGWVWISSEPYGWATYHYGEWYYDDYQGWVWIPGDDWGPAWVSWTMTDDYAGWAPMFPPGYSSDAAPGGGYLYVTLGSLTATDLPQRVRTPAQLGVALGTPVVVNAMQERDGVVFNAGPPFDVIARRGGPLSFVKLEDLSPAPVAGPTAPVRTAPGPGSAERHRGGIASSPSGGSLRRSGEEAAQRARSVLERGGAPPPTIGVLRPDVRRVDATPTRPTPAPSRATPSRPAAPDSTKRR